MLNSNFVIRKFFIQLFKKFKKMEETKIIFKNGIKNIKEMLKKNQIYKDIVFTSKKKKSIKKKIKSPM
jgi:hypothetical protein